MLATAIDTNPATLTVSGGAGGSNEGDAGPAVAAPAASACSAAKHAVASSACLQVERGQSEGAAQRKASPKGRTGTVERRKGGGREAARTKAHKKRGGSCWREPAHRIPTNEERTCREKAYVAL